MNIWQSIALGLIQGVTEFLPVSSSGHLVLFQNWLRIFPPPVDFDLFLHLISVLVIIVYFRQRILKLDRKMLTLLTISTIPFLIIGFLIKDSIDFLFSSNIIVGFGLLITASFNFMASSRFKNEENQERIDIKRAGIIGLFQAIAVIPGVSRSGSTLFGAGLGKVRKEEAYEFSFLMAMIAILVATTAQFIFMEPSEFQSIWTSPWSTYLAGGVVCFFVSLASLKLLKLTLQKTGYHFFGWYCLALGIFTLVLALI